MLWHNLDVEELADEVDGYIRSRTSEPVALAEIRSWIEDNCGECEAYGLAPHSIANRILAEREAV